MPARLASLRRFAPITVALLVSMLAATAPALGSTRPAAACQSGPTLAAEFGGDTCPSWASVYDNFLSAGTPGYSLDHPVDLALDSTTGRSFAVGISATEQSGAFDYVTIGVNADGTRRWTSRASSPASGGADLPHALVMSPDGSIVFVTGGADLLGDSRALTLAYDSATGEELWRVTFDGLSDGGAQQSRLQDVGTAMAVSPDGEFVFVAAQSLSDPDTSDTVVIAYDALTGARVWSTRYSVGAWMRPDLMEVSSSGDRLWVVGNMKGSTQIRTVAFATGLGSEPAGKRLWVNTIDDADLATADDIVVTADDRLLFVVGYSTPGRTSGFNATHVHAIDAAQGKAIWDTKYPPDHQSFGYSILPASVDVSPDGKVVYMATASADAIHPPVGTPQAQPNSSLFAVTAYDTSSGTPLWTKKVGLTSATTGAATTNQARDLAVSRDGKKVYVTGRSVYQTGGDTGWSYSASGRISDVYRISPTGFAAATFALDAEDGHRLWSSAYTPVDPTDTSTGGAQGIKVVTAEGGGMAVLVSQSKDSIVSTWTNQACRSNDSACTPAGNLDDFAVLSYS